MRYEDFSPASRVWIYQSSRSFSSDEIAAINQAAVRFTMQWTAHNKQLKAWGGIVEDRILVLMVDETAEGASGCSIDSSVHFVQQLEQDYNTDFFNRLLVTYRTTDGWETTGLAELEEKYGKGEVKDEAMVINTLVSNKAELDSRFEIPLRESWIASRLSISK